MHARQIPSARFPAASRTLS